MCVLKHQIISLCLILTHVKLSVAKCNISLQEIPEEERMLGDLVPLVIESVASECSLVYSWDSEYTVRKPLIEVIRSRQERYQQTMLHSMADYTIRWQDYLGIGREEQMFTFRSMPPSMKSRLWPGGHCVFNVLLSSSFETFPKLIVHTAASLMIRNLYDHFLMFFSSEAVHALNGTRPEKILIQPPANGIKLKLAVYPDKRRSLLKLRTICFFCNKGRASISNIGSFQNEEINMTSVELYPDTTKSLNGREIRMSFIEDIDIIGARERLNTRGYWSINLLERISIIIEDFLNAKIKPVMQEIGELGTELRLPNGSWVGSTGNVVKGRADFALATFFTDQSNQYVEVAYPGLYYHTCFLTRKPHPDMKWYVIFQAFEILIWSLLVLSILISAVSTHLIIRCYNQTASVPTKVISVWESLKNILRGFLDQPEDLHEVGPGPLYAFSGCLWLFMIVMNCAYKTRLVSLITYPEQETFPTTFEELAESDIGWGLPLIEGLLIRAIANEANIPLYLEIVSKSNMFPELNDCFQYALTNRFACLTIDFFVRLSIAAFDDLEGNSLLQKAPPMVFNFYTGSGLSRDAVYAPWFIKNSQGITEWKLFDKWMDDESFWTALKMRDIRAGYEKHSDVLTIGKLLVVFYMLLIGLSLALLVFLIELFRRNRKPEAGTENGSATVIDEPGPN